MNACSINHPTDLLTECIAHMHTNGILFDGCLNTDGELHRFSRDSKKTNLMNGIAVFKVYLLKAILI